MVNSSIKWLMLCREPRLYSCQRIKTACEQRGISLNILDPNRMLLKLANVGGKSTARLFYQTSEQELQLDEYHAVLPRFGATSTEMGCYVLQHFEIKKTKVLNSAQAFRLARDKWQSLQLLAAYGLPIPSTSYIGELVESSSQLALHFPAVVLKTLVGMQGTGVELYEETSTALNKLKMLKQVGEKALVQDFIVETRGQDIRAFVIGDQVVASMQRIAGNGDFRANLHQGGKAESIELTEEEKQIAIQATKAIGLDVAGVDLIRSKQGPMILEVNASPGLEGIETVSGKDIAGMMVDYLLGI
ncbi:ribosomal protein S6 modification protein [Haemophilus parahaemolyticus HK385]|uniref:Glutathione synthetase, ATP-binding domain protein n=1 Tax=Haemophilus parahaemolyticus HK385 TaxID=1095744 RepID=A0ABN0EYL1_HAEPH|nr:glutathione synthetase, ATP-binding domain protein [Haemophilus parahaemolyticus HK385]STO66502.1 ribosomal protein S6 modification protein [Haemophilus parahaemolyticus HK385]